MRHETQVAPTHFRTVKVAGLDIFYREAGDANALAILLLHGFSSFLAAHG